VVVDVESLDSKEVVEKEEGSSEVGEEVYA